MYVISSCATFNKEQNFIGLFTNYFRCYFLPAKARKRQRMFFTRKIFSHESNIKGEVCFFVLPRFPDLKSLHPPWTVRKYDVRNVASYKKKLNLDHRRWASG